MKTTKENPETFEEYDYKQYMQDLHEELETKEPVYAGCPVTSKGGQCFCTGECRKIVDWREKKK